MAASFDADATATALLASLGEEGAQSYVADQLTRSSGAERARWESVVRLLGPAPLDPATRAARLQAALLTTKRFAGRAELEKAARAPENNNIALAKLRMAIGFPGADKELAEAQEAHVRAILRCVTQGMSLRTENYPDGDESTSTVHNWTLAYPEQLRADAAMLLRATPAQREVWAMRHRADGIASDRTSAAHLGWKIATEAIRGAVAKRNWRHKGPGDPLTGRGERHAENVIVGRRIRELVASARFRRAAHSHHDSFETVPEGQEGAVSDTSSVRDGKWFRTTSTHHWRASRALFSPAVRELNENAPYGVVYLRPDLRVVQGRGTALNVERLKPAEGKRKASWK